MAEIPNLAGVVTKDLIETIGSGKFTASYVNWSRTLQLLRINAPGWMSDTVPAADGSLIHRTPVGGHLLIRFVHVDDSIISDCSMTGSGMYLYNSNNNEISNNAIASHTSGYGILVQDSDMNLIKDNDISSNYEGIHLSDESENNDVLNNHLSDNRAGIYLWYSKNNVFESNEITENIHGVKLQMSSNDNVFRFNDIFDNSVGAYLSQSRSSFEYNNIYSNENYNAEVYTYDATGNNNWWGTISRDDIDEKIKDCNDYE